MPHDPPAVPAPRRAPRSRKSTRPRRSAPATDRPARSRGRNARPAGGRLGPYETAYDVAHGYTAERTILTP